MNRTVCLLLASIKNAGSSQKSKVVLPYSIAAANLCDILYKRGYISYYKKNIHKIEVGVKYFNSIPLIKDIQLLSIPSRRVFVSKAELLHKGSLYDTLILSSEKGLISVLDAYALGIGGQLICKIN